MLRSVNGYSSGNLNPKLMETLYFLGIDVGKDTFHGALTVNGQDFHDQEIKNTPTAIKQYFQELQAMFRFRSQQLVVCMEHTGIYCYPLLSYLTKHAINVCVEPAVQIKQSQGFQRGKNDKIDSKRIARYVFKNHADLKFWRPKRDAIQKLRALLVVRERLIMAKTQFEVPIKENKEFIKESISNLASKTCQSTINAIKKDIQKVNQEISKLIKQDVQLSVQMKLATSVTGIGTIIAANMIITTNEFKDICEYKKYACYAGIAPFERSSGKSIWGKPRVSHMANKRMKTLLHMGARSAIQHSPELKQYYHRKRAEGKAPFKVLNAVCNKLISRVFVCINNNRLYQKNYHQGLV